MQAIEPKAPYRAPDGGFAPYGVGYVDLGDVIVESRLLGDPAGFEIGMADAADAAAAVARPGRLPGGQLRVRAAGGGA